MQEKADLTKAAQTLTVGLVLATGETDRHNSIAVPAGWAFASDEVRELPLLFNHDSRNVIGRVYDVELDGRGWLIAKADITNKEVMAAVAKREITGDSIGFNPLEYSTVTERSMEKDGTETSKEITTYKRWNLVEVSLCAIPSIPSARVFDLAERAAEVEKENKAKEAEEAKAKEEAEAKRTADEAAKKKAEDEAEAQRKADEKKQADDAEAKRKADEEAAKTKAEEERKAKEEAERVAKEAEEKRKAEEAQKEADDKAAKEKREAEAKEKRETEPTVTTQFGNRGNFFRRRPF